MMRHARFAIALLLILSVVGVSGFASAQAFAHESHHAHHQKAAHSTVLCSWMCAAGQVLDTGLAPYPVEQAPVAVADVAVVPCAPRTTLESPTSRGPPSHSIL